MKQKSTVKFFLRKTVMFCGDGGYQNTAEEVFLLIDGKEPKSARSGVDFSNDDHSRWDYVEYFLTERKDAEK